MDFTGGIRYSQRMKRFLILLILFGMSTGVLGSMLPPPPGIHQSFLSADITAECSQISGAGASSYYYDRAPNVDHYQGGILTFASPAYVPSDIINDPELVILVIDLNSNTVILARLPEDAYSNPMYHYDPTEFFVFSNRFLRFFFKFRIRAGGSAPFQLKFKTVCGC